MAQMAHVLPSSSWCLIESDPAVFSELVRGIGVQGVQVEELYDLDGPYFNGTSDPRKPVYGLVFLFKWRSGEESERFADPGECPDVYFAQQIINNACATQAILSIVLNRPEISLGEDLSNFKEFTKDFPPKMKGLSIGNVDLLHRVHNSFAKLHLDSFALDVPARQSVIGTKAESETYHFVSYVPVNGFLYELDGLSPGPAKLGACSIDNWLKVVKPLIQKRIQSYSKKEIGFNLMAVVKDKRVVLKEDLDRVIKKEAVVTTLLTALQEGGGANHLSGNFQQVLGELGLTNATATYDSLSALLAQAVHVRQEIQKELEAEEAKVEGQKFDNHRRKFNYLPMLVEFLKLTAGKGELISSLKQAGLK